jgi:glycosyltransferase involved in cell wall biosynthesis
LRIAQVVSSYQPRIGGVETHVQRLAEGCAEAGDDVVILTHQVSGSPPEERVGPLRVLRFPLAVTASNYQVSPGLSRYLRSHATEFALVHAHNYHTVVGHAAVRSGLPFVFTPHYHGTGHTPFRALLHRLYRPIGARMLGAADAIICVSDAEHALVIRDFPGAAGKAVTIPNGSDRRPRAPDRANRAMPDEPVVLTVGRLERYKNVDVIIDAFRALPVAASLVIVGDGPDRGRLEQQAAITESGWPVVFTGTISDAELDRWYARARVVTSASEHEAFGLTLTEGLASGARVVASAIPAHAEIASRAEADAEAAVALVDPRDTREFTRVLAEFLASGRVTGTCELPSWADNVARTRDLYARVRAREHLTHRREPA